MGGISFIIYTDTNISIDFIKKFMDIKHRGISDSAYITESSINLNTLNTQQQQQVSLDLSRNDIRTYKMYTFVLGFHRMSINDTSYNATQPFEDPIINKLKVYPELRTRPNRKLICNGEIYNYSSLVTTNEFTDKNLSSSCDVEIILPLYIKYLEKYDNNSDLAIVNTINDLDGEFTFVLTENLQTYITKKINVYIARDYLGIKPLYYITNNGSNFYMFVSEIKALPLFIINNETYTISQVPPGSYWSFQSKEFIIYNDITKYKSLDSCVISNTDPDTVNNIYISIRNFMIKSVVSRFQLCSKENVCDTSDMSFGILLSGGFDSSLLTSILMMYLQDNNNTTPINLFTIGDDLGSDTLDINYSYKFIEFLKEKYPTITINHHKIYINDIDILASDIEKIIYHLETYDPETIRDSIPYYYLFKYIQKYTNVKILLTGDGLDELCGYSNFNNLSDDLFQSKSVDLLLNMCNYDLLRTDKMGSAFNLEIRHPFLQKTLVEYILSIHPKLKRQAVYKNTEEPIEKYIIRKAFDTDDNIIYLPNEILWRRSSCVCENLTNFELRLDNYFNELTNDQTFDINLQKLLKECNNKITLPKTKQEMFYRLIFNQLYPNRSYLVPQFWNNIWD